MAGGEAAQGETRAADRDAARSMRAGSEHYTAYVGPPKQYDFMGATQFRLLCALGLREHHSVLDFGCGSLRAGRLLIPYLLPGRYHGLEPNRWLIEDAIDRELGRDAVEIKRPVFRHEDDFRSDRFGTSFDFIVAQSIFSHTGLDLVRTALRGFKATLKPTGLVLATFIHPERLGTGETGDFEGTGWIYPGCVAYRPETLQREIEDASLVGRALPWYHPRQTWYALAHTAEQIPPATADHHLSGGVLRDPELAASVT